MAFVRDEQMNRLVVRKFNLPRCTLKEEKPNESGPVTRHGAKHAEAQWTML